MKDVEAVARALGASVVIKVDSVWDALELYHRRQAPLREERQINEEDA